MCGRFTLTLPDYESLSLALGIEPDPALAALYRPRFNLPPMDPHWILRMRHGARELLPAHWGLIPRWAKGPEVAPRQINARSESVQTKPAFRDAFTRRRCVVPADGFFEWTGSPKARRPVWFHPKDGALLLFAGLYEKWRQPESELWRRTFTIITTPANDTVKPHHDRMPAILTAEGAEMWLRVPELGEPAGDGDALQALLEPAPNERLEATPVSRRANSVSYDDPECLEPEDAAVAVGETLPLFGPRG